MLQTPLLSQRGKGLRMLFVFNKKASKSLEQPTIQSTASTPENPPAQNINNDTDEKFRQHVIQYTVDSNIPREAKHFKSKF